ncbi:MAG: hypothetical protein D6744_17920 [Planctomycetota bacterium]|nr:MAG: hypothetical protein D6744_17920 [Planctomycetota bacterium]
MRRRCLWRMIFAIGACQMAMLICACGARPNAPAADRVDGETARVPSRPATPLNFILILADDLGYGDLGCYGQRHIATPRLDQMAAQGMRFTDCYAGAPVCAPSRCALLTGKHTGHAQIRGNAHIRRVPLAAREVTIAEVLRNAGFATAAIGKWGLGGPGTEGVPMRQGFDSFYGFLTHAEARRAYPEAIWRDERLEPLTVDTHGQASFADDLFTEEALEFIERNATGPFFLYLAYTAPHFDGGGEVVVPDLGAYADRDWTDAVKARAARITRLDRDVGRILDRVDALGIADRTLVLFSSDNGPRVGDDFFQSAGPFRGAKSSLYEGSLRVPMIVRWKGTIAAGGVSDYAWAHWDVLPTFAALAGVASPQGIDGISIAAVMKGDAPPAHPPLYWETHELQFEQAARMGRWKGIRRGLRGRIRLFDLAADPGESVNVAAQHRDEVRAMRAFLDAARVNSPDWPVE